MMEPQLKRRQVRITRNVPRERVMVEGDRVRLEQVLINLLRNAIKYGWGEEPVRVQAWTSPPDASRLGLASVSVAVVNRAESIREEDLDNIFQRYQRGYSRKSIEGSGIGLYVVNAVANDVPLETIFRGIVPLVGALIVCNILLIAFPEIALYLPNLMR